MILSFHFSLCTQQAEFRDGKYVIGYMAIVKVTLVESGASHEDCGFGEGIHESKLKAYDNAMKSAVTDAMKRAARHFGERLGNGEMFVFQCRNSMYCDERSLTLFLHAALYLYGNGMNRAPKDNKTALRDLEQQEASDLFGNQNALRELRAKSMQEAAAAAASEKQGDSDKDISHNTGTLETRMPPPPKTTLVRQNTPPTVAATNHGKENSPSQLGHGFMRASELGVVVTPGQQAGVSGVSYQATSPQQQTPYHATKPSPPSVPRYAPLETQPSQRSPASNGNQANPLKRQKVVHNPYQQQH